MGKHIQYSDDLAERLCDRLAQGDSMRLICTDADMPDRTTVMRWMDADAAFAAKCARAREIGLDDRAEALREEMDNEEDVQRARLMFDHAKWYLSKLAPKKYGDKLALTGDEGGPLQVNIVRFSDQS